MNLLTFLGSAAGQVYLEIHVTCLSHIDVIYVLAPLDSMPCPPLEQDMALPVCRGVCAKIAVFLLKTCGRQT